MPSKLDKIFKVRDPVYGFIKLDAQEMDIVNSPYFQRLRRIRQLSFTDMVYPGACHTRFEHSLGVMQMAADMFGHITAKNENLKRLHVINKDDLKRTLKIIRLAALLHDVGHAPFSHAGEECMPLKPGGGVKRYEHEDYSIAAIKYLFRDLIETHPINEPFGIKAEDVTALLGDKTAKPSRSSVLWKALISSQLDADKADYLLRDSLHIGVDYGIYDRNLLINSITLGESDESDCFLAIEHGGWHVAESLVIARYQMFSQVYFHPVRRAFDHHVAQALKEVAGTFPAPVSAAKVKQYLAFDDWKIYDFLQRDKAGRHGALILLREPFKCKRVWDGEPPQDDLNRAHAAIARYGGYLDRGAVTKWYKLDDEIQIFDEKNRSTYPLSYQSKLIGALPESRHITRLYIDQEESGADYEFP